MICKPNTYCFSIPPARKRNISFYFQEGTFWLTQKAMADLFGVKVPAVNKHLKNVLETGEMVPDSVISKTETTAAYRKNYNTNFYCLRAILALGYRVNRQLSFLQNNSAKSDEIINDVQKVDILQADYLMKVRQRIDALGGNPKQTKLLITN